MLDVLLALRGGFREAEAIIEDAGRNRRSPGVRKDSVRHVRSDYSSLSTGSTTYEPDPRSTPPDRNHSTTEAFAQPSSERHITASTPPNTSQPGSAGEPFRIITAPEGMLPHTPAFAASVQAALHAERDLSEMRQTVHSRLQAASDFQKKLEARIVKCEHSQKDLSSQASETMEEHQKSEHIKRRSKMTKD